MNNLIEMFGEMTMGTREIAKLLNRDHSDIRRSANRLVDSGVINGGQPLADTPYTNDQNGQTYYEYRLNKLDSITLVAQNCPQFTAALVKRWDELERGVAKPSFMDSLSPAAVIMLEDLDRQLKESMQQLAIAAPKADVFDRVIEREALLNATQVAQQIGMSAIKMNRKLDELGGVYNKCVKRGRAFCHDWVDYFVRRCFLRNQSCQRSDRHSVASCVFNFSNGGLIYLSVAHKKEVRGESEH